MCRLLLVPALLFTLQASTQVVINEVHTSNRSGLADAFGEFEDWVELYNTANNTVDLSGWHLSNKANNPTKWAFPAGASIAGNGHLVVFCSKRNTQSGGQYHTNFNLEQVSNDHVVLADPSGVPVDDVVLVSMLTKLEHSRGRSADGAQDWALFTIPTPGAPNTGGGAFYAAKPQFSPAAGFHAGSTTVTISTTAPNSAVHYTLDGSTPDQGSPTYATPITVSTTTVVRAITISNDPAIPPSFVETGTYFIDVSHTTAVISIAGAQVAALLGGNNTIEPYGSFEYFGPDQQLRDKAVGQFDKHGNDSWAYPQRGFDYVTRDEAGYNDVIHYPIFHATNRSKFQRLIIKGGANDNYPFEDGAHIRDAYVQSLAQAGGLRLDVRTYEPCVLYLNGQYWGVYEIREKVDDNDYTREYYDQDKFDLHYLKTWGATWSKYGGQAALDDWNALRAFIMGNDMGDPAAFSNVDAQYDWKSLVDYVVLNSYVVCSDWLNWNTAWWRGLNPDGGHQKWGYILWDNDGVFGHYINYTYIPDQTPAAKPCDPESLNDPGGQGHVPILNKLIEENPTVHDYYVNRYIDLGNTLFSCQTMLPYLDSLVALITPEMPGQVARWGGTMAGWEANVQQMRDFITARCTDIQAGMVDCYELEGPYNVVFKVEPPGSGIIRINSITPGEFPFTGLYYGGINTELEATATGNDEFDHWEFIHGAPAPGAQDPLVTVEFGAPDTVIAHFKPPIVYPVVLISEPPGSAAIRYNDNVYADLPISVPRYPEAADTLEVLPGPYYTFKHWEFKHNTPGTGDSTVTRIPVVIHQPDTVIAHLEPQEYAFFIPNAFSPNGDGINDTWRPISKVVDVDHYLLEVFDRWGHIVYTSRDPHAEWDGTVNGRPMPLGVYGFRAVFNEGITGLPHDIRGSVTLVP